MSLTYSQKKATINPDWVSMQEASARTGIKRRTLQAQCDRGFYESFQRKVKAQTKSGTSWQLNIKHDIFKKT